MLFRHERSISGFNEREIRIRLYYTYMAISAMENDYMNGDLIDLLLRFASALKSKKRLAEVVLSHVYTFISEEKFHLVDKEDEDSVWKFSSRKKLVFHFYEDEQVYDAFASFYKVSSDVEADLARCIYAGGKDMFLRIIEQTFFNDKAAINLKKVAVPKSLLKEVNELVYTKFLCDAHVLTKNQALVLQAVYRCSITKDFHNCLFDFFSDPENSICSIGIEREQLDEVINNYYGILDNFLDSDFDITPVCHRCLTIQSLQPYFNEMSRVMSTKDAYALSSYSVKKESTSIAKSLLLKDGGTNILLYGAAGSGKTEYAKSLAKACGLKAIKFKNSYEAEESVGTSVCALNVMLSIPREDIVFIVDEAETLLETKAISTESNSGSRKGTVNKLFEQCKNRVIWIVNYTDKMDESTKRRFTYSIFFDKMSEKNLTDISQKRLTKLDCPESLKTKIINLCGTYEVTGASINNMMSVMKAFDGCDEKTIENNVRCVLESNAILLNGQAKMREKTKSQYDMSVVSSTIPASNIIEMIENAQKYAEKNPCVDNGIRMLFYGLSGTGKTEFARYIAGKLGKKILLKRPSDIISKWVGDSEKNISDAFAQAERTDQILLFDEADSFFRDRSLAQNEWEITKTNEFLTQMEEFKGILICTTNLRNIMDKAMLRRFHICTEFKALGREGIEKMLNRYFSSINMSQKQIDRLASYNSVTPGDFGAIAGRVRFMSPESVTADYIVEELLALQKEKEGKSSNSIGFCA